MSKILVALLALCVGLAVLRTAVVALVVALVITLLVSFITRPRETLVFVGTLFAMGMVNAHPIACLITAGAVVVGVKVAAARREVKQQPRLPDLRDR